MYRQGVTFHTGWVNTRPLMEEPLGLITQGGFDGRPIETAVVRFGDAPDALTEPFTELALTGVGSPQ